MSSAQKRLIALLMTLLGSGACGGNLPSFKSAGATHLEEDEKRIWNRSKEMEEKLVLTGQLYGNPAATAYVNRVAAKLAAGYQENGLSFRVEIVKNPYRGAFSLPDGHLYIHTGLLASMENEAQLATILGHEMTHVIYRHATQQFRRVQNASATLSGLQIALMPLGGLVGALVAAATISGYSKAAEEEADREGLDMMVAAGYDPREAPVLFDQLKKDLEARKIDEPFFFGSHPRLAERKESYQRLLQDKYAKVEGFKGTEIFMQYVRPVLLDNAVLDISMGRFDLAQEAIEKYLRAEPASARARFQLGDLYRRRNGPGDGERAEKEYVLAIEREPNYAEPLKALGLLWLKQGKKTEARQAFERSLALTPAGEDRGYIEQYVRDLAGEEAGAR